MAKQTIGLDLGKKSLKVICLDRLEDNSYQLLKYILIPYDKDLSEAKDKLEGIEFKKSDLRVNIEDSSLKIRRLDLPQMEEDEIPEAVKWGLKNVIKDDLETYEFRYVKIEKEDLRLDNKIPVVVFALKKDAIAKQMKMLTQLGINSAKIVEPDAGALSVVFDYILGKPREDINVLIDLGYSMSLFTVMGKGSMLFSRPLNGCADVDFMDQVSRDLGFSEEKKKEFSSQYFREKECAGKECEEKLNNTKSHFFSKLAIEIQRSMDGYMLMFEQKKIAKIYLSGGGAYYEGLNEYLGKTLGVEVQLFDPFQKFNLGEIDKNELDRQKSIYTVACGLAID